MVFKTQYLQLTVSNKSHSNTYKSMLEVLNKNKMLLLRRQDYEKYFKDTNSTEIIIFLFVYGYKKSELEKQRDNNDQPKMKERVVGRIKLNSCCYQIEWDLMDDISFEDKEKDKFTHFIQIEWVRQFQISQSKLPSDFSALYSKKEGFHRIQLIQGHKLKDVLDYPSTMYKKIYKSLNDKNYIISANSSDSDSSGSDQSSDSSSSSSQSESEASRRKRKNSTKRNRSKSRHKRKQSDRRSRKKDRSKGRKQKDRHRKKKDQQRRKRSESKRSRKKSRDYNKYQKEREDKKKNQHKRNHNSDKSKYKESAAEQKKRSEEREKSRKNEEKEKSRVNDEKGKDNEECYKRKEPAIVDNQQLASRNNQGAPSKKLKTQTLAENREQEKKSEKQEKGSKKNIPLSQRLAISEPKQY